jgi:hypothetical protein
MYIIEFGMLYKKNAGAIGKQISSKDYPTKPQYAKTFDSLSFDFQGHDSTMIIDEFRFLQKLSKR